VSALTRQSRMNAAVTLVFVGPTGYVLTVETDGGEKFEVPVSRDMASRLRTDAIVPYAVRA
jgi:hypothetical protein